MPELSAPRLSLTWRVALLAGVATTVLAGLTLVVSYLTVRSGLYGDLRRALREDAAILANLYDAGGGSAVDLVSGPTGGTILQVYGAGGELLAASRPEFERAQAAIPPSDIVGARRVPTRWSGRLGGRPMEVALAPFSLGVVGVLADPSYIDDVLANLSRSLLIAGGLLVVVSLLVGYGVAASSLRPVTRLANRAALLGPERLDEIAYRGPNDEVGRLAHSLNDLVRRLRDARDAQRVFLAETSHELRTPLTSLTGFLDRAARRAGPAAAEDLRDAQRVSVTMTRLVEDLLQLSRGEIVKEAGDHLVDLAGDVLRPVAAEFEGVAVEAPRGLLVLGDPQRLRQLARNLVANGVRAAGRPAGVTLRLAEAGGRALVTVEDDGPGIAPELLERIFEKFYKGAGGGSGLGLAIARQIAVHHGGTLGVTSRPGQTVFEVRLPLVTEEEDEEWTGEVADA